jgi:hypothetical protein
MSMSTGPSNGGAFFDGGPAFTDDGVLAVAFILAPAGAEARASFTDVGFAPDLPPAFTPAFAPGFADDGDDGFNGRGALDAVEPGTRFVFGAFAEERDDFGDDVGRFFVGICGPPSPAAARLSTGSCRMMRPAAASLSTRARRQTPHRPADVTRSR